MKLCSMTGTFAAGVGVFVVRGVVTVAGLRWLFAEAGRLAAGHDVQATVGRFESSVWAMTAEQIAVEMGAVGNPALVAQPAALVVSPAALPLFKALALEAAALGIQRRVVSCYATGHRWALASAAQAARQARPRLDRDVAHARPAPPAAQTLSSSAPDS